jgi:hypothetical protein
MENVLDIYKLPYNHKIPVVCMDESPKQMIKETRLPIAMRPGSEAKIDFEYERCGVANIFIATEPLKGKRFVEVTERKTKVILVMDNLSTHSASALYETFKPEEAKRIWDRFQFVYTPKHGSWLNMAEIELNVLMGQCLNRRIDNMVTLKEEAKAWESYRNNKEAVINWQFTSQDARIKLKRLYPTILY